MVVEEEEVAFFKMDHFPLPLILKFIGCLNFKCYLDLNLSLVPDRKS